MCRSIREFDCFGSTDPLFTQRLKCLSCRVLSDLATAPGTHRPIERVPPRSVAPDTSESDAPCKSGWAATSAATHAEVPECTERLESNLLAGQPRWST
jgi:hypothetical protein